MAPAVALPERGPGMCSVDGFLLGTCAALAYGSVSTGAERLFRESYARCHILQTATTTKRGKYAILCLARVSDFFFLNFGNVAVSIC